LFLSGARAAELEIHYTAIRKILAQEVFTQDGRRYVHGSRAAKCSFAYPEHPELRGDNGTLTLKARSPDAPPWTSSAAASVWEIPSTCTSPPCLTTTTSRSA
jgi:hypothetical protein